MPLPTDIDATYPDRDSGDRLHQQHHDTVHAAINDPAANWPEGNAAYRRNALNASRFAIDFTGATDSTAALQALVTEYETGNYDHAVFPSGLVRQDGPVLCNTADPDLIYKFTAPRGLTFRPFGMVAGDAMFHLNRNAAGASVASSFASHPHFILDGIDVDGTDSTAATLVWGYQRNAVLRRCRLRNMYRGLLIEGYTDLIRLEQVHASSPRAAAWLLEMTTNGDGVVLDQVFSYLHGVAKLFKQAGVSIQSGVGGWFDFLSCLAIDVNAGHYELASDAQPTFKVQDSHVAIRDTFTFGSASGTATGAAVVEVDDSGGYRRKSDLLLDNVQFAHRITAATDQPGPDVKLTTFNAHSLLRMRDCRGLVYSQSPSARWVFDAVNPLVTSPTAAVQTALDADPTLLMGSDTQLRFNGSWLLAPAPPADNLRIARGYATPTLTAAESTSYPGDQAAATYYYKVAIYTPDGNSNSSTEASAVLSTVGRSVVLTPTVEAAPARVRVWRGTSTGVYDRYVDLAVGTRTVELFDLGGSVSGRPWITTGVPTPPSGGASWDGYVIVGTGVKHLSGAGTPEGRVAAPVGSTYARTDGGAGTSHYVKETGAAATGWVAK